MRPPCEVIVRYVLPTFRSLVAKELIEKYNYSQTEVAKKLGITQASISLYLYSKRGNRRMEQLGSIPAVQLAVKEVAREIEVNKLPMMDIMMLFCKLCRTLVSQGAVCSLHRDLISASGTCKVCLKA